MKVDEICITEDILLSLTDSTPSISVESNPILLPASPLICSQCPLQRELNKARAESAWWQAMHSKAKDREEQLKNEIKDLEAKLRLRERQLFGKGSEKSNKKNERQSGEETEKKKRGQQRGAPGHGRKKHDNLPKADEYHDLPEEEKFCPCCGLPFKSFSGTEESEVVEVDVRAHVRRIIRKKYIRTCTCPNLPVVITAKGPDKLIPKGAYGDSVWIQVLLDKFLFYRPTSSLLDRFDLLGLEISQGTITDGLKRLKPLFEPVYEQIVIKSQTEVHWHADETRWMVFAEVEGKNGYRWYLWVFKSDAAVVYILDQSRSSRVPLSHLEEVRQESILSVDRYGAYKTLIKEKDGSIRLATPGRGWAHVRRDFLSLAKDQPDHEEWAMEWVEQIGILYHINNLRIEALDVQENFDLRDEELRGAAIDMEKNCAGQLEDKTLHPARRKVLESLQRHWDGLTIFIDHPEIPMDNNAAEQALRGPVVGRKNFYGSGSLWSGLLASMMFSIFQTLILWNINPQVWLEIFFRACAENRGRPPEDVSPFLPWNMSEQELEIYRKPPKPADDTS